MPQAGPKSKGVICNPSPPVLLLEIKEGFVMKTAILYYSEHHGNTKKLLDAIALEHEVTLVNITKETDPDLSGYDRVGLASGIYYGTLAKQLITWAKERLPEGKDIFLIVTQGAASGDFLKEIRGITEGKHCKLLGSYTCRGFDTFGPFKLVGGIAKGHPTEEEIRKAVSFYAGL